MPSVEQVKTLLQSMFEGSHLEESEALHRQIDGIRAVAGPITMLDFVVDRTCGRLDRPDGPLKEVFQVGRAGGEPVGELLTWVSDGYLSGLEYAWWTDEPPTALPDPADLLAEFR